MSKKKKNFRAFLLGKEGRFKEKETYIHACVFSLRSIGPFFRDSELLSEKILRTRQFSARLREKSHLYMQ